MIYSSCTNQSATAGRVIDLEPVNSHALPTQTRADGFYMLTRVMLCIQLTSPVLGAAATEDGSLPQRMLFEVEGAEQLAHALGGLLNSQYNFQLSLMQSNNTVEKQLAKVCCPATFTHSPKLV